MLVLVHVLLLVLLLLLAYTSLYIDYTIVDLILIYDTTTDLTMVIIVDLGVFLIIGILCCCGCDQVFMQLCILSVLLLCVIGMHSLPDIALLINQI